MTSIHLTTIKALYTAMLLKAKKTWIILMLAIIGGYFSWQHWQHPKNLQSSTSLYKVKTQEITSKATAAGIIIPKREAVIAAPYNGYVKHIYVKVGQDVRQGAPLVSVSQSLQAQEKVYPIRAPYPGKVVIINKTEGEYVSQTVPSSGSVDFILKVDDLSSLYVDADISERDIAHIKQGQQVLIKPASASAKLYHGIVTNVALSPKPQQADLFGQSQVVYPVKIKVSDPDRSLYPGMTMMVDIILQKKNNVLVMPHQYLRQDNNGYYVVLADNKKVPVKIGIETPQYVEITSGLSAGQAIKPINYFDLEG